MFPRLTSTLLPWFLLCQTVQLCIFCSADAPSLFRAKDEAANNHLSLPFFQEHLCDRVTALPFASTTAFEASLHESGPHSMSHKAAWLTMLQTSRDTQYDSEHDWSQKQKPQQAVEVHRHIQRKIIGHLRGDKQVKQWTEADSSMKELSDRVPECYVFNKLQLPINRGGWWCFLPHGMQKQHFKNGWCDAWSNEWRWVHVSSLHDWIDPIKDSLTSNEGTCVEELLCLLARGWWISLRCYLTGRNKSVACFSLHYGCSLVSC